MSTAQPPPEKSKFSRRCSLLSRYLKKKGSFGNIDMALARKFDLELAGKSSFKDPQNVINKEDTSKKRAFELIQKLGEASTPTCVVPKLENSQLTIFFGGKVLVFNEFPEEKAKKIMKVAKEVNPIDVDSKNTQKNHMNLDMNISNKSNVVMIPDLNEPTSSGNNDDHQTIQQHLVVERIARRASLHRFFAKRKER